MFVFARLQPQQSTFNQRKFSLIKSGVTLEAITHSQNKYAKCMKAVIMLSPLKQNQQTSENMHGNIPDNEFASLRSIFAFFKSAYCQL